MSDTNEALDTQAEPSTPEERAAATIATMEAEGSPVEKAGFPVEQAEEVATSEPVADDATGATPAKEETAEAAPEADAPVADEAPGPDLSYLPDEYRERLLASYNRDDNSFTIPADDLTGTGELKSGWMRKHGFHEGMRKNAETRKEHDGLIRDGENWRKLFKDDAEQAKFLEWREGAASRAPSEAAPEFTSDAEIADYATQRALELLRKEQDEARAAESRSQAESEQVAKSFLEMGEGVQTQVGASDDEFEQACTILNERIRASGRKPWDVLTDQATFADALVEPLRQIRGRSEIDTLKAELAALKNEQSKTAIARDASASSPRGSSGIAKTDYPDTPEGRARQTMDEYRATLA